MKRMGVTIPQIILLILLAVGLLVIVWRQEDWIMPVRLTLAFGAIMLLAVAIVAIVAWAEYNAAVIDEQRQRAWACSERVRLVMELANLNPEQIAALGQYAPVVELAGGNSDYTPIPMWRVMGSAGDTVSIAFIQRLIEMGDEVSLPAMRSLPETDYAQYKLVMGDFVQRGWVSPARGNQPARWLDRQGAINQIFGGRG